MQLKNLVDLVCTTELGSEWWVFLKARFLHIAAALAKTVLFKKPPLSAQKSPTQTPLFSQISAATLTQFPRSLQIFQHLLLFQFVGCYFAVDLLTHSYLNFKYLFAANSRMCTSSASILRSPARVSSLFAHTLAASMSMPFFSASFSESK